MPRVRIVCQSCGRKLSHLEIAPRWTVRATCPACKAVTVATLDAAGNLSQVTAPTPAPVRTHRASGRVEKPQLNGRQAG